LEEDQKKRESTQTGGEIPGTFGDGANAFDFNATRHQVDPACTFANVTVLQDYSCVLALHDIDYNQISKMRVYKMQLLERNDKLKWFVWTAHGKMQEGDAIGQGDKQEFDASTFVKRIDEFFNMPDAIDRFEKGFLEKTCNKWSEREYFQEKPGKFVLQNKEKKQKMIKEAFELENELL